MPLDSRRTKEEKYESPSISQRWGNLVTAGLSFSFASLYITIVNIPIPAHAKGQINH